MPVLQSQPEFTIILLKKHKQILMAIVSWVTGDIFLFIFP